MLKTNKNSLVKKIIYCIAYAVSICVAFLFINQIINNKDYINFIFLTPSYTAYFILNVISIVSFVFIYFLRNSYLNKSNLFKKLNLASIKANSKKDLIKITFMSLFMSVITVLPNYYSFYFINYNYLKIGIYVVFIAAFTIVWYVIFKSLYVIIIYRSTYCSTKKSIKNNASKKWFFIPWITIFIFYLFSLCFFMYPGNENTDGFAQIFWIENNWFKSTYTFFQQLIIKVFYLLTIDFNNSNNLLVFFYCTFICLLMSACFAYLIQTIHQLGFSKIFNLFVTIWFSFMPLHIFLCTTMFSDILFTAFIILFVISFIKIFIIKKKGKKTLHYVILFFSVIGMTLSRTNGVWVALFTLVVFCLMFYKKSSIKIKRIYLLIYIPAFILSVCFLGPIQDFFNVDKKSDVIHYISIPCQQVGRVVVDCDDLSPEQEALIEEIMPITIIKKDYSVFNFDNLKFNMSCTPNWANLFAKSNDYLLLYIKLWVKHPCEYIFAWIDSTKNYWNPYNDKIDIVTLNFLETPEKFWGNNILNINNFFTEYLNSFWLNYVHFFDNSVPVAQSMGFYFWIFITLFFLSLLKKDKNVIFTFIPVVGVLFTIFVSAPCLHEIRYVYPMICLLPLYIALVFFCSSNLCTVRRRNKTRK